MGKKVPKMPEIKVMSLATSHSAKPPLHAPVIKVSCGIGDTDGFPAFDVDSDAFATPNDQRWGFQITGGSEFHMPITVFQVSEDGLAAKGGISLGDILLEINGVDARNLRLSEAHDLINKSTKKIAMLAKGMDDEGIPAELRGQDKFINLRMPKPAPPKPFVPTPLLGTRMWHPVMWQDPPPPPRPKKTKINEDGEEVTDSEAEEAAEEQREKERLTNLPHHRIIKNIRRFFNENKNKELRGSKIEDMLLILPSASKVVK
ncbi:hypothetical protein ACFFRR_007236 [Megaselia abdita]